jgi:hypothetical protein
VNTSTPKSSNSNITSANYIILNNDSFSQHNSYSIAQNETVITVPKITNKSFTIKTPTNNEIRRYNNRMSTSGTGLYSLKDKLEYFKREKLADGFNFICNCGQFTTRSQVSLVRHIWLHQKAQENHQNLHESLQNDSEVVLNLTTTPNHIELKAFDETISDEVRDEENMNTIECQNVMSIAPNSHSRRNLTFKKYKFQSPPVAQIIPVLQTQDTDQNEIENEISPEDLYFNNLIVKIEDRGYFCQWAECDFSDDKREIVVSHIRESHLNGMDDENDIMRIDVNGYDIEFCDNEANGNISDSMTMSEDMISPEQSSSQFGNYNVQNYSHLIDKERRNSTLMYLCKANDCLFETALSPLIVSHIREHHFIDTSINGSVNIHDINESTAHNLNRFQCKFNYCNASFPSYGCLVEHQKIHGNQIPNQLSTNLKQECAPTMSATNQRSHSFETEVNNEYNTRSFNNKYKFDVIKSGKSYSYNGELGIQNADKYSEMIWQKDGLCVNVCKWSNCGYKSYVRGNMIRHIRKHTGDKPFVCNFNNCGQRFAYSTDVKIHQRRDH